MTDVHTGTVFIMKLKMDLFNMIKGENMVQLIGEPTRYSNTTANLLDLIIADSPGCIKKFGVVCPLANLDHCTICCVLNIPKSNNPIRHTKDISGITNQQTWQS